MFKKEFHENNVEIENKVFKKYVNQIDEINYICVILKSYCNNNASTNEEKAVKSMVNIISLKTEDLLVDILDKYPDFIED